MSYKTARKAVWKQWNDKTQLYICDRTQTFDYCTNSSLEKYNNEDETNIAAPTVQMTREWLKVEHNAFISIIPCEIAPGVEKISCAIYGVSKNFYRPLAVQCYGDSEKDSIEKAAKYCLENLIGTKTK